MNSAELREPKDLKKRDWVGRNSILCALTGDGTVYRPSTSQYSSSSMSTRRVPVIREISSRILTLIA
jgi:hypothetical protein